MNLLKVISSVTPSSSKIKVRNFFLRGNSVHCPLCDGHFITFLPFGTLPRANALCPGCGSLERTRLYWLYFKKENIFGSKIKFLHVAPERQIFKKIRLESRIEYYPVDKFMPGYSYPEGTVEMDILDINYEDNFFDFILCSHVLEHIPEDRKALSELFRVLKPGGKAILQVPIDEMREHTFEDFSIVDPELRTKVFGEQDHVRLYGRDYRQKLEQAGFKVTIDNYCYTLDGLTRFRNGLILENLYVVEKVK